MKPSIAKLLLSASCCILIFFGNSCNRGCDEADPIYKHLKIPDWAKEKYAYKGNETLVFYEINGTDTAELTFIPFNNQDTTYESIRWYEADNGDLCRGYQTDLDVRIDQYYCAEREWYFTAMLNAEDKRIKIEFYKRFAGNDYNFYAWFDPEIMMDMEVGDSLGSHICLGTYHLIELNCTNAFKLSGGLTRDVLYDLEYGFIEWYWYHGNRKLQLKELKR